MAETQTQSGTPRAIALAITVVSLFLLHDLVRLELVGNHQRQLGVPDGFARIWLSHLLIAVMMGFLFAGAGRLWRAVSGGRADLPGGLLAGLIFAVLFLAETIHHYRGLGFGIAIAFLGGGVVAWVGRWFRFRWIYPVGVQILILLAVLFDPSSRAEVADTSEPPDRDLPNVFLIVVDTARADHFSCYGYSRETTPFLSGLARRSAVYQKAYSGTPTTTPSTAAILGASFPFISDYPENRMRPKDLTLARDLLEQGFQTVAVSANPFISPSMGFDQGFTRFANLRFPDKDFAVTHLLWVVGERLGLPLPDMLRAERVNPRMLEWLDSLDPGRPVFGYLHYMDPHYPYTPSARFRDRFLEPGQAVHQRFPSGIEFGVLPHLPGTPMPEDVGESMIALYDAEIAEWDHHLGLLWEELDRRGRLENALVIVTSDHGEAFHEHDVWLHGNSIFNEVLRVPLLVYRSWSPDPIRIHDPVTNTRIPHLIRAVLGRPPEVDRGTDPLSLLATPSGSVVAQYSYGRGDARGAALIDRKWKSLVMARGTTEFRGLFDLDADPGEVNNLTAREPEAWESGVVSLMPTPRPPEEGTPLSRATEDLLESLGYTN